MSEDTAAGAGGITENGMGPLRSLSVRMSDGTRAQLEILAQLNDRSLTEETRYALEHWVDKSKLDPAVLKRAEQVRAEIERDAETKRNAINAVLGSKDSKAPARTTKQAQSSSRTSA